jgi:hypothetical protein
MRDDSDNDPMPCLKETQLLELLDTLKLTLG